MSFPLRVHGHHSLLVGVDSPTRLVHRAGQLGLEALALTDVDSVAGVVEFLQAAARLKEEGQPAPRPIIGAEISDPAGRPGRLIALVETEAGWCNLCKLVSARRLGCDPGSVQPNELLGPASFDLIASALAFHEGLIFLVDHPRLVLELSDRLPAGQLWAAVPMVPAAPKPDEPEWDLLAPEPAPDTDELERLAAGKCASPARPTAALVRALIETARAADLPLVAAPDIWYIDPEEGPTAQRVRAAIRAGALVERVPDHWLAEEPAHLAAPDHLGAFDPAWLAATHTIAARCQYTPPLGGVIFPSVDCGETGTPYSELARLAFEGAARRYRPLTPEVIRRLETELSAIDSLGFAAYFLLVHQIAGFARKENIPHIGRGSAADSLVAYCLDLTDADPIRYQLPFERFLNPTRKDRPDIDLDFCWRRRDEVLDAVYSTFGPTRTAMISTLGAFGLRSAFREASLAVGLAPAEFERWSKRLPWSPPDRDSWKTPPGDLAELATNPVAQAFACMPECRHFPFDQPRFRAALAAAATLLDVPRHMGLHPGGVVVAPRSITDHTACARAAKGPVVTQFDKDGIEALGLVKMDLLGNRALTVIDDCLRILRTQCGVDLGTPTEFGEALAEDDEPTAELLRHGRAVGCFQIESPGMRHLLQQIEATCMDDVIQAIALIRPGPASSGMKDAFIRRFRGKEEPTPPHPLLEETLRSTHGVMLYQEDVMQVAADLAGMSLAEADRLRRALSKRRSAELDELGASFREGAAARGVSKKDAAHVWELIANFAAFGFCKAHAVTYGRIAYRTAWLKTHYPIPFLTAFLASHTGYYATRVYIEEARRLGAAILGPDINRSGADFTFESGAIRAGLGSVRGLGEDNIEVLLDERKRGAFLSLPDLKERVPGLDRGELETLIQTGALDAFDRTRPELLWRLHLLTAPASLAKRTPRPIPGEPRLDLMELESLRATPASRVAERAASGAASGSTGGGNMGWGGSSGRLPLESGQASLAFPARELSAAALPALPGRGATEEAVSELELLGFTTRLHPVVLFADKLPEVPGVITPCAELPRYAGHAITVRGWLAASRRHRGTDGRWMRFLTLEDESGLCEAALFADAYDRWAPVLCGPGPYLVEGTAEDQMGAVTLHVTRVKGPA